MKILSSRGKHHLMSDIIETNNFANTMSSRQSKMACSRRQLRTGLQNKKTGETSSGHLKITILAMFKHIKAKHKICIMKLTLHIERHKAFYYRIEKHHMIRNPMGMFNSRLNKIEQKIGIWKIRQKELSKIKH